MQCAISSSAFVEIWLPDLDRWNIPEDWKKVISPHVRSEPTWMSLQWPIEALPQVGDRLNFCGMGEYSDCVVTKRRYVYRKDEGLRVIIETVLSDISSDVLQSTFRIRDILWAAEEGFMLESATSLAEVLAEAGLPSTAEEYKKEGLSMEWF